MRKPVVVPAPETHLSVARSANRLGSCTLLLALTLSVIGPASGISQSKPAAASNSPDIIQFLTQAIGWYRQLAVEQQISSEPNDVMIVNNNRQIADQVVQLAFEFARSQVESPGREPAASQAEGQGPASSEYQSLLQLSAKLDKDVQELQGELQSVRQKLETATGRKRQDLQSLLAETQSELNLAVARKNAVQSMAEFVGGASTNGLGATGLRAEIEALARSVPAALSKPSPGNETSSSASEQSAPPSISWTRKSEPSGIWGLTSDLFTLSQKAHSLADSIQMTDALARRSNELRAPLVNTLKDLSQQGDDLAKKADTAGAATLAQEKKQLDALTAQFKQTSALVLPLSKEGILLGVYKRNLADWQNAVTSQYKVEWRILLLRMAFLAVILIAVLGLGQLWRRAILRYVHDVRRRYQFLLLRRIALWFSVAIIIAFAFANELGSIATFAGLLTAGVAVALQNVILSVAGYFFLIGRFGIRVGDRVQIAGVTGEVVDIGLVRLHLMELGSGGAETPSGRVVAFPNSIVFQANAGLFKQIPGTNFDWHEITLTLSSDSDYGTVEQRVRDAADAAFSEYGDEMERQHRQMEQTLTSASVSALRPKTRLRFTPSGLEVAVRFPVDLQHATEIDNRVMRELLKAVRSDPSIKSPGSTPPNITLRTDLSPSDGTQD
jgi:small-conductance mechanosensitive channel